MTYYQIQSDTEYTSWVKLEYDANKLIEELREHSERVIIKEGVPYAKNVLFFQIVDYE